MLTRTFITPVSSRVLLHLISAFAHGSLFLHRVILPPVIFLLLFFLFPLLRALSCCLSTVILSFSQATALFLLVVPFTPMFLCYYFSFPLCSFFCFFISIFPSFATMLCFILVILSLHRLHSAVAAQNVLLTLIFSFISTD